MSRLFKMIFLLLLFLGTPVFLFARAHSEVVIPPDPTVRAGVLPNGMSYYVRAHSKPSGMAELRLAVKAGSILEDEDQKGLAHFTEHMLFNGTQKFPENELIDVLESFGMAFGPEVNAYTAFDETVYKLSVKTDDPDSFLLGWEVLEEWAFHATLTEKDFEEERGVIYEEWRVGRGASARLRDQMFPVLLQGSRYAERNPIGDEKIIQEGSIEALRRYYKDWYRPELMGLIAVGDFDPDETVNLIKERFSSYSGPASPRPREKYEIPSHPETLIKISHDPEATQTNVQVYGKYKKEDPQKFQSFRREIVENLFYMMINQRLEDLSSEQDNAFLQGYGFDVSYTEDLAMNGLAASLSESKVLPGLEALLTEAERIHRFGFLDSELERAKKELLSTVQIYWAQQEDAESDFYVDPLLDAFLTGQPYPSLDWYWENIQNLIPTIGLEEVQGVNRLAEEANRVIIVNGPSVPAVTELTEGEIREVLQKIKNKPLKPWEEDLVIGPLAAPPEPGWLVSKTTIPRTDISSWILSNGARIIIKPTDFKKDEILFKAYSPGGLSQVEDEDFFSAQFLVDAVQEGGMGEFSASDLSKTLAGKKVDLSPFVEETHEGFSGRTIPQDLETMLQLLHLYQTDPRRDPVSWEAFMTRMEVYLENRNSNPKNRYNDFFWETLFDNHFRSLSLQVEQLSQVDLDKALALYGERFKNAADFTYFFVGDIDLEILQPLVEQWIGSLPSGKVGEGWIDRGVRSLQEVKTASIKAGKEPLSLVSQVWTGQWDGSFRERYHLQSLAAALEMKLTRSLREDSGGTYSVRVYPHLEEMPVKDYRFIVRYSCDPQRVEELTTLVKEEAATFRDRLPDKKYAQDVAASQRRNLEKNLSRNDWWMGQMTFAMTTQKPPVDLMDRNSLYDSLTPELLQNTAKKYLDGNRYLEVILFPEEETE